MCAEGFASAQGQGAMSPVFIERLRRLEIYRTLLNGLFPDHLVGNQRALSFPILRVPTILDFEDS